MPPLAALDPVDSFSRQWSDLRWQLGSCVPGMGETRWPGEEAFTDQHQGTRAAVEEGWMCCGCVARMPRQLFLGICRPWLCPVPCERLHGSIAKYHPVRGQVAVRLLGQTLGRRIRASSNLCLSLIHI